MLDAKHIFSLKDTAITIVTAAKSSSNDIMVPLLPNNTSERTLCIKLLLCWEEDKTIPEMS